MDASRRLRILLLEDQALVRAGMKALIQISEPLATIREASSYDEAVETIRNANFDIAFLDIDLKEQQTGLHFLRYIRSLDLDTRAIMLSGRVEKDLVMSCIEAGASGYILKDMDSEGLFRRALDTVFQGNIFLPASVIGRGGFQPLACRRAVQRVSRICRRDRPCPGGSVLSLPGPAQQSDRQPDGHRGNDGA